MRYIIPLLVGIWGCKPAPEPIVDNDNDGADALTDCDDDNASIRPGADELCDGVDQDCDGEIDEGLINTFYPDSDNDGFGDPDAGAASCGRPTGFVEDNTDCDDTNATVNPGVVNEQCDDLDHNCDGDPRLNALGGSTYWPDTDADGFGLPAGEQRFCEPPAGFILVVADLLPDCNDTDPDISPAASELCSTAFDDDCDGLVNEADAIDGMELPVDLDGDGRGSILATSCLVGAPIDTDGMNGPDGVTVAVNLGGDCDDTDPTVAPGLPELCDGQDNDCDASTTDENHAVDRTAWWRDVDGDGTGTSTIEVLSCNAPVGYVSSAILEDCDDGDPLIFPGTAELCDGSDNNCDGFVDDSTSADATSYYEDVDGDGYGNRLGLPSPSCGPVPGLVDNNEDCDDQDVNVGTAGLQYRDSDGDLFGDPALVLPNCIPQTGYVTDNTDCDDNDPARNPNTTWYEDSDTDQYGSLASTLNQCEQPTGFVENSSDCDDTSDLVSPAIAEDLCDTIDNDCDLDIDEDCVIEHCGTISTAEVWASDRIHVITCDVNVSGPAASLTIEDAVEVRFAPTRKLRVGVAQSGTLFVLGGGSGVYMGPQSASSPELWGGIELGRNSDGSYLSGVTVQGAGSAGYAIRVSESDVVLEGVDVIDTVGVGIQAIDSTLEVISGSVVGSSGIGITLDATSDLVALSDTLITGGTLQPLQAPFRLVELLADGNAFSGNAMDEVILTASTVLEDTTASLLDVPYRVRGTIGVGGGGAPVLTIESGVEMRFEANAELDVARTAQGAIRIEGTDWDDAGRVSMVGVAATPGTWRGLRIGRSANPSTITGLDIQHAGGNGQANLHLDADPAQLADERPLMVVSGSRSSQSSTSGLRATRSKIQVLDSVFDSNLSYGAVFENVVFASSEIDGSTFSNNSASGVRVNPSLVELLPNNSYSGNTLPIEILPGTVVDSAVWEALEEDYYITGSIEVTDTESPVLTIQPGTNVYFGTNGSFTVGFGQQGSIVIPGDATNRVLFSSIAEYLGLTPERGSYPGLSIGGQNRVSSLRGLTVRYAGSDLGAVYVSGDGSNVVEIADTIIEESGSHGLYAIGPRLLIHDSTFRDNDDQGLFLQTGTQLIGAGRSFANNVITGNGKHAITLPSDSAGELDTSSTFAGNNLVNGEPDRIEIRGNITTSQLYETHDASYWIASGNVTVGGQSNPVLTITPGAVFEVAAQSTYRLNVGLIGDSGGIVAQGTPGNNVVFTSDAAWEGEALPGDWSGIFIGGDCLTTGSAPASGPSRCTLEYVTIDYAGAGLEEGALMIQERRSIPYAQPALAQNLTIRYSGTTALQFQVKGNAIAPNPTPSLPEQMLLGAVPYPAACEGDTADGSCANTDYCWNGTSHGISNNLFCGNEEANVSTRNFTNPFVWDICPGGDGPAVCP